MDDSYIYFSGCEVCSYDAFMEYLSVAALRKAGQLRLEGSKN